MYHSKKWIHGKRKVVEANRLLTAPELAERDLGSLWLSSLRAPTHS